MSLERFPYTMYAEYNQHVFSALAETLEYSVTPVYDQAGREVIYCVYKIVIKEIISPDTHGDKSEELTAGDVEEAIAKLSRPAGIFKYQKRGFGDLKINLGPKSDVVFGPKPRVTGLKPIGGGLSVELTWTVEVAVPNCPDAVFKFALMEFNWTLAFDKDAEGYTTRIYAGFLRIPSTRKAVDDLTLKDTADGYLEDIYPPMLEGFRRIPGTWKLDEAKTKGAFEIRDVQMPPTAPPTGIIDCEVGHVYTSITLAQWQGTINASYKVDRAKGKPGDAVRAFVDLVKTRADDASLMKKGGGLDFAGVGGPGIGGALVGFATIVPVRASAEEVNIYGRTQCKFSLTYLASGIGFDEILRRGGLWEPVRVKSGGDWKAWAASVATSLSERGHARLVLKTSEDKITGLCRPSPPAYPHDFTGRTPNTPAPPGPGSALGGLLSSALAPMFPIPKPADSWLDYRVAAIIHPSVGRIVGNTLPTTPLVPDNDRRGAWNLYGGLPANAGQANSPFPALGNAFSGHGDSNGKTFVHHRTSPSLFVTIVGQCLRAGHQIPQPELVTVNGKRPVLVGEPYFTQGIVSNAFVPVVRADFRMTYVFTDEGGLPTSAIPVPPNSLLG